MTWIVWRIRSWFCKHTFEFDECARTYRGVYGEGTALMVSRTCTKCGWHTSYRKFG